MKYENPPLRPGFYNCVSDPKWKKISIEYQSAYEIWDITVDIQNLVINQKYIFQNFVNKK